jgi:uncharacterized protein YaiI (UPF0178 family)
MTEIYVDADACPVKDEVLRVAERNKVVTHFVTDGGIRPPSSPLAKLVIVLSGPDAADDWIAEHVVAKDIVVTNDIPLAARALEKGAGAIRPNGELYTEAAIGGQLATRELMAGLRETGAITGGPRAFSKRDRSNFLSAFENAVRAAMRA